MTHFHSLCDKKTFASKSTPGEFALSFWVDFIFERELFTKCSWAGGSRDKGCPKVAFKNFDYVINFLLHLARSVEPSYTLIAAQKFTKGLLQYSKRRSAPKLRPPGKNRSAVDSRVDQHNENDDQHNENDDTYTLG